MKIISAFLCFVLITACAHSEKSDSQKASENSCTQTRAAFDVGSATTRLMVAQVDVCNQTLLNILKKEERAVPYKDDLERSATKEFSTELQTRGLSVFTELSALAKSAGAARFAGTATSAFRSAKNAEAYLARVKSETGVSIHVIDQKAEAELGFLAALTEKNVDPKSVVVWDVGGGSMQFSARDDGKSVTSLVELGSVGFKNEVLKLIRPKAPLSASPNPIGEKNFDQVVALAEKHALEHTDPAMRALLKKRLVIGIGGVHSSSILKQTKQPASYDLNQVESTLRERIGFSDTQVGGAYAATDVTNLALVLGYMRALEIKTVRAINVNLTSGTVLYPKFWQSSALD